MLRYYSYYSVGGYKDFFLGTSESSDVATYYLPLLGIQRKRAVETNDEDALKEVERQDELPKIYCISLEKTYGFPRDATRLISHGGYKLVLTHTEKNTCTLVLRDICGIAKDESGRAIPFLMMIVADSSDDIIVLGKIAAYWSNHIATVSAKIASLLVYDSKENGLRFDLGDFNKWIKTCATHQNYVSTIAKDVDVALSSGVVNDFILLPDGITKQFICDELGVSESGMRVIPYSKVYPLDDEEKTILMKELANEEQEKQRKKQLLYYFVGGVIVGLLVALLFSTRD